MRTITRIMINKYGIKRKGMDFMGYKVDRIESLSFHHLIIPRRESENYGIGDGYLKWNGAILTQDPRVGGSDSHDYLHLIERIDEEIFNLISSEMIDENLKGEIDIENLRKINMLLEYFEREHIGERNKKGKEIIKEEYVLKRVLQNKK